MMKYLMVFCILIGCAGHASENICNGVDKFDLNCADLKRKEFILATNVYIKNKNKLDIINDTTDAKNEKNLIVKDKDFVDMVFSWVKGVQKKAN